MSNAARIIGNLPQIAPAEVYLGPATVTHVKACDVRIELPHGSIVDVQLAFAFPYEPALGDKLLVISKDEIFYAIGVLAGSGRTSLAFQGDVELRAIDGSVTIAADKGIEMNGPEIAMRSGTLRVIAEKVVQKFSWLHQRVSELMSVQAKEMHTVVNGPTTTNAKSATITTEDVVTVNGKQIHLG